MLLFVCVQRWHQTLNIWNKFDSDAYPFKFINWLTNSLAGYIKFFMYFINEIEANITAGKKKN